MTNIPHPIPLNSYGSIRTNSYHLGQLSIGFADSKEDWKSALPFHEKAVGVNPFFCGWDKFIS